MSRIHPTAIVHPDADVADDAVVGPFCNVDRDVTIASGAVLDAYVQVLRYSKIGSGCRIHSFASIGGEPQDLKFNNEASQCVIGENCVIREYVTVHRGTEGGGGLTSIGNGCLLMAYVHIAHDCILGNKVILSNGAMLAGHVVVGDSAAIGGMTGVHQFVKIGDYSFLGAMSGLAQDLPPYMLASGTRAKLHGPNLIGLRRQGFSQDILAALRTAYKRIWRSEAPRQQALTEIESTLGNFPEVMNLVEFVRSSERGVLSASAKNGDSSSPEREPE